MQRSAKGHWVSVGTDSDVKLPEDFVNVLLGIKDNKSFITKGKKALALIAAFRDFLSRRHKEAEERVARGESPGICKWNNRMTRKKLRAAGKVVGLGADEVDLCDILVRNAPPEIIEALRSGSYTSAASAYKTWKDRVSREERERVENAMAEADAKRAKRRPKRKPVDVEPTPVQVVDECDDDEEQEYALPNLEDLHPVSLTQVVQRVRSASRQMKDPAEAFQRFLAAISIGLDRFEAASMKCNDTELAHLVNESRTKVSPIKMRASHLLIQRGSRKK